MSRLLKNAILTMAAMTTALSGCAALSGGGAKSAARGPTPFGGAPAVEIPASALAMGAFLKAEVAMNGGDRAAALKYFAAAVHSDPANGPLRMELATLYVHEGRLKDALPQAERAVALEPKSTGPLLLAAGINWALGHHAAAEKEYRAVLDLDPKNQEAFLYLGTLYAERKDFGRAKLTFDRMIALEPDNFLGYYYAGKVETSAGKYPAAANYYQKALSLVSPTAPQAEMVLLDLALLNERQGLPQEAAIYYKRIAKLDPHNDLVLRRLAEIDLGQQKHSEALGELEQLEAIEANPAGTRTKIGRFYLEREDFGKAVIQFNLVLGAEPKNYRVCYYLGTAYFELGESRLADAAFEKIPPGGENYVDSRLQLAYLRDKDRKFGKAISALKQALAQKPGDPEIMSYLVGVYQEKKDYPPAIELAKKLVAQDPKNDKYRFMLGALYDQNQERNLGVEQMKAAIGLNPANAQALNYLGYTYAVERNHLDAAEQLVKRALEVSPNDGFYVDSLGWVYYQKGEYRRAVDQLERAVNLTNNDPTITEHLGDAYRKIGKIEAAGHEYRDALANSKEPDQIARLKDKLQELGNATVAGH
ncbi:MAG: tetratricopeptide repeat protein [Candidatus Binataceae bacterium]